MLQKTNSLGIWKGIAHGVWQLGIMEHSATDVQAVIKWWLVSRHPRADYLRENGHGIDTLLRASNFAKYLEMAQEPKQGAPPSS